MSDLLVVVHLSSDQFQDVDDCPTYEDDAHVYYYALGEGEPVAGEPHEELAEAIEQGVFCPYVRNFFILSRPEPDPVLRTQAILEYLTG